MAQVFISYAHEDRELACRVAAILERKFSVWWDRDLAPSRNYLREIDARLREARCVVVLWTPAAVASDYVLAEANLAREQGKLAGALLRDVDLPVPFGLIQAADLHGWDGEPDHPGIERLEAGIRACIGAPGPVPKPPRPGRWRAWLGLVAPTLIAAALVFGLSQWPRPTAIEAEVVAKRARFRLAGEAAQSILGEMPVRFVEVRGFRDLTVPLADGPLVLRPVGPDPASVSIRPVDPGNRMSTDPVVARSAEVVLEAPEAGRIAVRARGLTTQISLRSEIQIDAVNCASSRSGWPRDQPSVPHTGRVSLSDPVLEFSPGEGPVWLVLDPMRETDLRAGKPDLQVEQLAFDTADRAPDSAIVSGTLRFPDLGRSTGLNEKDPLRFEQAGTFRAGRVDLLPTGLRMKFNGVARRVAYGAERERFTLLSMLAAHPAWTAGFAIAVWLLPQFWAWRRFGRAVRL